MRLCLRPLLTPLLAQAIIVAAARREDLALVPMPSSRAAVRRRGEASVTVLCRQADAALGHPHEVVEALSPARRVADQAGLGSAERRANLVGAYAVPPRWRDTVAGRNVLLVDDVGVLVGERIVVATNNSSAVGVARALRAAGAHVVGAAVVAATQRRGRADVPSGLTR